MVHGNNGNTQLAYCYKRRNNIYNEVFHKLLYLLYSYRAFLRHSNASNSDIMFRNPDHRLPVLAVPPSGKRGVIQGKGTTPQSINVAYHNSHVPHVPDSDSHQDFDPPYHWQQRKAEPRDRIGDIGCSRQESISTNIAVWKSFTNHTGFTASGHQRLRLTLPFRPS
ncbi:hypothetical protein GQ43DRAFT_304985 [Delitschia confertaspora ATCC 74209]|uniref:Uncharacterized protein n=1 Tax=Delitschia confertaspora ATCC 74209 TaxID=1513339 RepID=A0A9P4MR52_9PLEO|nr:hypothetical protein GQ43DRAFT_304985 [Delitschia confertaspora ATCC 74209]